MAKYYLGIDVGTFETKGVLVNEAYEVVATHSAKHEMENPQPNHFEQDAEACGGTISAWFPKACCRAQALTHGTLQAWAPTCWAVTAPVDENCQAPAQSHFVRH